MGVGETGVGETGVGEMGIPRRRNGNTPFHHSVLVDLSVSMMMH